MWRFYGFSLKGKEGFNEQIEIEVTAHDSCAAEKILLIKKGVLIIADIKIPEGLFYALEAYFLQGRFDKQSECENGVYLKKQQMDARYYYEQFRNAESDKEANAYWKFYPDAKLEVARMTELLNYPPG